MDANKLKVIVSKYPEFTLEADGKDIFVIHNNNRASVIRFFDNKYHIGGVCKGCVPQELRNKLDHFLVEYTDYLNNK